MSFMKGKEIPTIDCELITITVKGDENNELALNTSSKIAVEVQTETTDAQKLIVKGKLIAQKKETKTITGNKITLTDNVFNVQLVEILQGGTIKKDVATGEIKGYTPPVAGQGEGKTFTLNCYSAIYNAAGACTGYEKIQYPNCTGEPIAFSSEDNVFRAPEYVINSAPNSNEAPYDIDYVDALPEVAEYVPTNG